MCIIFLNAKASEKCPSATCLYSHKARRKDSKPVLVIWNFKKTKASYNQKLYPVKPGKLCRQTLEKKWKENDKLLYSHSCYFCTNGSSLANSTKSRLLQEIHIYGGDKSDRGSRWQCTHFLLLPLNFNNSSLNSILKKCLLLVSTTGKDRYREELVQP